MVVCPRCGARSDSGASFCSNCGLPLATGQPAGIASFASVPPPHRSRGPLIAVVLLSCFALIALLAGAGAGLVWLNHRSAGTTTAGNLPTPSTTPSAVSATPSDQPASPVSSPTATPTPTAPAPTRTSYPDFAAVYKAVASGVFEVKVSTCSDTSIGTGFLVGRQRLVTAAHVINGASTIRVSTGHVSVAATIVGIDKSIDLAVLRLDRPVSGHVFSVARQTAPTGTHVITIGYPLAGPKTLTEGTVSGLGRSIRTQSGTLTDMLQTDTPINPGNSGGPFLDVSGRVIGFADAVRIDAQGIGYAIPSNEFSPRLESGARPLTPVSAVSCDFNGEAGLEAVQTVIGYHEAINTADYATAMTLLTPSFASSLFPNATAWYDAYATTYDDDFDIVDGNVVDTHADIRLRFRSQQAPGYGPTGAVDATCLRWDITYHLVQQGSRWLLDGATPSSPAWTRC